MKVIMRPGKQITWCVLVLALGMSADAVLADVVVVVSSNSPVVELNKNQLADIFLGKVRRFPDGREVVPIDQEEGMAARDEFYAKFIGKSATQIKAHWSKIIFASRGRPPKAALSGDEVKNLLAENPNAIGYIERSEVDSRVKVLLPK